MEFPVGNNERIKAFNLASREKKELDGDQFRSAQRTAFVARFIVLREGRRSRAHRAIEAMEWNDSESAEGLYFRFRDAFIQNGDKLRPVDRDLRRALEHAECSAIYFLDQYVNRMTLSFREALDDYKRSNELLFGDDEGSSPRKGGWRLPE